MAIGDQKRIAWPFAVASAARAIIFSSAAVGGTTSSQEFTAGTYLNRGASGSPTDLVAAFELLCEAAYDDIFGGGPSTFNVALASDGKLTVNNTEGNRLFAQWTNGSTTFDGQWLGFDTSASTAFLEQDTITSTYQVAHCWYPRTVDEDDSKDFPQYLFVEGESVNGDIDRVVHGDLSDITKRRILKWNDIAGARIWQARTDDATAAGVADLATGDPNAAIENLVVYLLDDSTPQPGQIYVFDKEDPSTATQSGPYQVRLSAMLDERQALGPAAVNQELRQYQARIRMELKLV